MTTRTLTLLALFLLGCEAPCPDGPALDAVTPVVTSEFADTLRHHPRTVIAWFELRGRCIDGGWVEDDPALPVALGQAPGSPRHWGTWYVWSGEPDQVLVFEGAEGCHGAEAGCTPFPDARVPSPEGPWVDPLEWWETVGREAAGED